MTKLSTPCARPQSGALHHGTRISVGGLRTVTWDFSTRRPTKRERRARKSITNMKMAAPLPRRIRDRLLCTTVARELGGRKHARAERAGSSYSPIRRDATVMAEASRMLWVWLEQLRGLDFDIDRVEASTDRAYLKDSAITAFCALAESLEETASYKISLEKAEDANGKLGSDLTDKTEKMEKLEEGYLRLREHWYFLKEKHVNICQERTRLEQMHLENYKGCPLPEAADEHGGAELPSRSLFMPPLAAADSTAVLYAGQTAASLTANTSAEDLGQEQAAVDVHDAESGCFDAQDNEHLLMQVADLESKLHREQGKSAAAQTSATAEQEALEQQVAALFNTVNYLREAQAEDRNAFEHEVSVLHDIVRDLRERIWSLENQPRAYPQEVVGLHDALREELRALRDDCSQAFDWLGNTVDNLAVAQARAAEAASIVAARDSERFEELLKIAKAQQVEVGMQGTPTILEEIETSGAARSTSDDVLEITSNAGALGVGSENVEALVTTEGHRRGVMREFAIPTAISVADVYAWLVQARLFCMPSGTSTTHGDGACVTAITDVDFDDEFEYSGPMDRLVVTPLAVRAYITLANSPGMYLSVAAARPALAGGARYVRDLEHALRILSTSETIPVKHLAPERAAASFASHQRLAATDCGSELVATSCTDHQNVHGVCQGGLRGCLDEFQGISVPAHSVVTQQAQVLAVPDDTKTEMGSCHLPDDTQNLLKPLCGYPIILNLGDTGRQELPGTLKQLLLEWRPPLWGYPSTKVRRYSNMLASAMGSTYDLFLVQMLDANRRVVLKVGAEGTVKTSMADMFFTEVDPADNAAKRTNASSATRRLMRHHSIEKELDKRAGEDFGPPGGKKMAIFIDDVSIPEPALEMKQPTVEWRGFCFVDKDKREGFKVCESLQHITVMGQAGGGKNGFPDGLKTDVFMFDPALLSMTSISDKYGQTLRGRLGDDGFDAEVMKMLSAANAGVTLGPRNLIAGMTLGAGCSTCGPALAIELEKLCVYSLVSSDGSLFAFEDRLQPPPLEHPSTLVLGSTTGISWNDLWTCFSDATCDFLPSTTTPDFISNLPSKATSDSLSALLRPWHEQREASTTVGRKKAANTTPSAIVYPPTKSSTEAELLKSVIDQLASVTPDEPVATDVEVMDAGELAEAASIAKEPPGEDFTGSNPDRQLAVVGITPSSLIPASEASHPLELHGAAPEVGYAEGSTSPSGFPFPEVTTEGCPAAKGTEKLEGERGVGADQAEVAAVTASVPLGLAATPLEAGETKLSAAAARRAGFEPPPNRWVFSGRSRPCIVRDPDEGSGEAGAVRSTATLHTGGASSCQGIAKGTGRHTTPMARPMRSQRGGHRVTLAKQYVTQLSAPGAMSAAHAARSSDNKKVALPPDEEEIWRWIKVVYTVELHARGQDIDQVAEIVDLLKQQYNTTDNMKMLVIALVERRFGRSRPREWLHPTFSGQQSGHFAVGTLPLPQSSGNTRRVRGGRNFQSLPSRATPPASTQSRTNSIAHLDVLGDFGGGFSFRVPRVEGEAKAGVDGRSIPQANEAEWTTSSSEDSDGEEDSESERESEDEEKSAGEQDSDGGDDESDEEARDSEAFIRAGRVSATPSPAAGLSATTNTPTPEMAAVDALLQAAGVTPPNERSSTASTPTPKGAALDAMLRAAEATEPNEPRAQSAQHQPEVVVAAGTTARASWASGQGKDEDEKDEEENGQGGRRGCTSTKKPEVQGGRGAKRCHSYTRSHSLQGRDEGDSGDTDQEL